MLSFLYPHKFVLYFLKVISYSYVREQSKQLKKHLIIHKYFDNI